jgi:hypothetical protein
VFAHTGNKEQAKIHAAQAQKKEKARVAAQRKEPTSLPHIQRSDFQVLVILLEMQGILLFRFV